MLKRVVIILKEASLIVIYCLKLSSFGTISAFLESLQMLRDLITPRSSTFSAMDRDINLCFYLIHLKEF